ncbi:hypothetical protein ACFOY2_52860 [Nonomuraea purpurea]|uniref:Uncharacterized protein n=1 Tax=Nonomuraea purpurea TaxID=1849276 RepID=A0ABV8GUI0_9ACTN
MKWEEGDYHGRHMPMVSKEPEGMKWTPGVFRGEKVRVRDHTCECSSVVYELCLAGGIMFIRRTRKGDDEDIVHEFTARTNSEVFAAWLEMVDPEENKEKGQASRLK